MGATARRCDHDRRRRRNGPPHARRRHDRAVLPHRGLRRMARSSSSDGERLHASDATGISPSGRTASGASPGRSTRSPVNDGDYRMPPSPPTARASRTRTSSTSPTAERTAERMSCDMATGRTTRSSARRRCTGALQIAGPRPSRPTARSIVFCGPTADSPKADGSQIVVAPADGSGAGLALGPLGSAESRSRDQHFAFTPDGKAMIAAYDRTSNVSGVLPLDGAPSYGADADGDRRRRHLSASRPLIARALAAGSP